MELPLPEAPRPSFPLSKGGSRGFGGGCDDSRTNPGRDDEEHIREIFAQLLAAEGYEVVGCGTIEEVMGILDAGEFDLAFVDIRLGAQSGLDVLWLVRNRLPFSSVMIVTGSPTIETAAEAHRHGACDYIVEPVRQVCWH